MSLTKEQQCTVCGVNYPRPIELHHDSSECVANQAAEKPYCWVIESENGEQEFVDSDPDLCNSKRISKPLYDHTSKAPSAISASVSVPREPTEAMLQAACDVTFGQKCAPEGMHRLGYAAMLAAAPAAPQQEPVAWVRTINGEIDWSEDCLHTDVMLGEYDGGDGYAMLALYAAPQAAVPGSDAD